MDRATKPQKKVPRAVTSAYLERVALDYLGKYSSSSENLRRVLLRKVEKRCRLREEELAEQFREAVDDVVAKALRIGLIDDQVYTQAKVASLRRKGNSGRLIHMKLAAKGLGRDDIREALDLAENDELQAARNLARRRRIGPHRTERRAEFRDKDIAVLARAGFPYAIAISVIDEELETVAI